MTSSPLLAATFGAADGVATAAVVVLLVLLAFLAMSETALTRVSVPRAVALRDAGRPRAERLLRLVEHPERFLNGLLLVIMLLQISETAIVTVLALRFLPPVGVVGVLVAYVAVLYVLGEAVPKGWAVENLDRAALLAAGPVLLMARLWPLRLVARGLIGASNVILPGKGPAQGPFISEEELLAMAAEAADAEVIEAEERTFISRVIDFGDTIVREVMVPRTDMVTVESRFRVADAMEVALLNGYSRIPVCGEGIDDVVGVIYAKDLMRAERDGREEETVAALARPARFVPETKRVAQLLREMQADKFHLAVVIDEYGGTAGLVTLEDLIEELVGEIVDEYDRDEPMVEPLPDGAVRVNARLAVDEANELLGGGLPEGDWDSVGGLLFSELGHVPVEGDTVEVGGFRLRADRVTGRRISRVRIARLEPAEEAS